MAKKLLTDIGRPVRRVEGRAYGPDEERPRARWPFSIPAVRQLLRDGLDLTAATVLVGDNGTGKSTIVEGIAEAFGLNPEGGSTGAMHRTRRSESDLADHLQLVRGIGGARGGFFLRAETMHSFFTYLEQQGFAGDFHERSHGESFLALINSRFFDRNGPRGGLFVLDEPESALSFASSLALLGLLRDMAAEKTAQILVATHSPVIAALPGATILELDATGFHPTAWEDLAIVVNQRTFLTDPTRYLRTVG